MNIDIDLDKININSILEPLFVEAQKKDEFEFCCSLLRVRGLEDAGWDSLAESYELVQQMVSLSQAPLDNKLQLRIVLFVYCHVTEMDDLYKLIANLLRVSMGERYSIEPFDGIYYEDKKFAKYPIQKIQRIKELSNKVRICNVDEIMNTMFVKQVRNAFFHSDYIVAKEQFNIKQGEGVEINGIITRAVPFKWLFPRINLGINFSLELFQLIRKYISSYKEEKIVPARILENNGIENVMLTIKPNYGLTGFHSINKEQNENISKK